MNILIDNLRKNLVINDNAESPGEGAIGCEEDPKVTAELSDFFVSEEA